MFENLLSFKKSVASLASEIHQVRATIEKLQRQREEIAGAPAAREDVKAMVEAWVSRKGATYAQRLRFNINEFIVNPREALTSDTQIENRMSLFGKARQMGGLAMFPGPELQDEAVSFLFGPQLIKSLHAAIDAMEWPPNALPLAGREARISELDAKIGRLTAQESEVIAEARNAGVTFDMPNVSVFESGKKGRSS